MKVKNRETLFRGAICVGSILLLVISLVVFFAYDRLSKESVRKTTKNGFSMVLEGSSRQASQYFETQHKNIDALSKLINDMDFTENEVIDILANVSSMNGNFLIVNPEDYQAIEILRGQQGKTNWREQDYANTPEIVKACAAIEKDGQGNLDTYYITDVFERPSETGKVAAICKELEIENESRMLAYIINFDDIRRYLFVQKEKIKGDSILLEKGGEILCSNIDEIEEEKGDFFQYIEKHYSSELAKQCSEQFQKVENGMVEVRDSNTFCISYCKVQGTNDWIYVQVISNEALREIQVNRMKEGNNGWIVFLIIVPLVVLLCIILQLNHSLLRRKKKIEAVNESLRKANEAQNIFISNMSHEIRTPINAVLGMDEMIIRESSEDEIIRYAYEIKSAGNTLLGIVNNILDFTKIESGKLDLITVEYDVGSVVNDLVSLIRKRVDDKGLKLQVHMDETIPHLLLGDELRIKQIVLNLLTNAVKYTEEGTVDFSISMKEQKKDKVVLKVEVKDSGIGMKPEEMDKLCKPFERLDKERNRTIEGTGLGMSIVVRLLKAMDSEIKIESVYGEGSSFSFELEQTVMDWSPVGKLSEQYRIIEDTDAKSGKLHASKARVLVVDDTDVNLTVVAGLLKRTGIKVDMAESGRKCLEMAANTKYDVILLDHRMPGMDGVEVAHMLRESEGINKDTVIIALTANATSGARDFYLKEGFNDFLAKPVSGTKLERVLLKYIPEDKLDTEEEILTTINEVLGQKNSGTKELYDQVCQDFLRGIDYNLQELEELYEKGDIENFTIKIHALKSSARLVGAMGISEEARYLEACGDEKQVSVIKEKLPQFLAHTKLMVCKLREKYPEQDVWSLPMISEELLEEILGAIREFLSVYDFEQIDYAMESLGEYCMPAEKEEKIERLKAAVNNVNAEEIMKVLEELQNE